MFKNRAIAIALRLLVSSPLRLFISLTFKNKINMYKHFFKRVIDFTIALIALLIIWPILLVIYI